MTESNRAIMRLQWRFHRWVWNISGSRLGRRVLGMPVVEVLTIGHRSGQERQVLLTYVDVDGAPSIIASNAGNNTDPAWAKNLQAYPDVRARWDGRWHDVHAEQLGGDRRQRVWAAAVQAHAGYEEYAANLSRTIPIFRLSPR